MVAMIMMTMMMVVAMMLAVALIMVIVLIDSHMLSYANDWIIGIV